MNCQRCKKAGAEERYSFTVYAGVFCEPCARGGFRDQCGLTPKGQGSPADLDEPLDPDYGYGEGPRDWTE